ncbi:heavy metal-associated isoprenylated plant protein 43-like [Tasmannia lanceolata]|uniref:heavy metal-associated isoprenylated plant protein 43-like n=1 Tax=Tasmannia lanceolata TaxID=3420 RepID=UPI0040633219
MVQRTVLKVDISCQKCKKKLLKAVSGLEGIDKIELDAAKNTLTVTGDVDPYKIIVETRKTNKSVEVMTIGPPPPPPKPDAGGGQKKPDEKKPEEKKKAELQVQPQVPLTCYECEKIGIHVGPYDTHLSCSIL